MLKKIFNNSFLRVFSYNGIVFFGKLISSFVVSKVSAIYLGPSGYAVVGNLKNVLQGALGLTASGFESGIIKYIAENKSDKKQLKLILSSVITLSTIISLIVGTLFLLFSNILGVYILKDSSLSFVFKYLGVLVPLISLNFLVIYIVNGLQKFKLYTALVTVSNGLNAILTFVFVYQLGLKGALIASVLVPSISFLSSFLFKDVRRFLIDAFVNIKNISITFLKSISVYLLMATYSSILISLSYLFIRNEIIESVNIFSAGLWEAMNKISSFYMMFFSSLFTLYLLPHLAINKTIDGYYSIMQNYFKYLIPFTIILFIGLVFFRLLVIQVFLTREFQSVERFFYLQLIGDFVKVIAFSIAYQFHAKKMVEFYFISDFILYVSFYLLSIYFIKYYNLEGVFYAYIISVVLYLTVVVVFVFCNNSNYLNKDV